MHFRPPFAESHLELPPLATFFAEPALRVEFVRVWEDGFGRMGRHCCGTDRSAWRNGVSLLRRGSGMNRWRVDQRFMGDTGCASRDALRKSVTLLDHDG